MKTRTLVGSVAAAGAIVVVAVFLTVPPSSVITPTALAQPGPPGITPQRLGTTLARAGLTAEGLAAVGADAQATTGVVAGMRAYLQAYGSNLYDADQALAAATSSHDALLREIQRGTRDQQTMEDFASAKTTLASANLALTTELQAAFEQAASGLSAGQRTLLTRIHENRLAYHMPTDLAAAAWTEADWLGTRDALCNIRQNQAPDPAAETMVSDAMELSDVATASGNLGSGLGTCTSAWQDAVETYGDL